MTGEEETAEMEAVLWAEWRFQIAMLHKNLDADLDSNAEYAWKRLEALSEASSELSR